VFCRRGQRDASHAETQRRDGVRLRLATVADTSSWCLACAICSSLNCPATANSSPPILPSTSVSRMTTEYFGYLNPVALSPPGGRGVIGLLQVVKSINSTENGVRRRCAKTESLSAAAEAAQVVEIGEPVAQRKIVYLASIEFIRARDKMRIAQLTKTATWRQWQWCNRQACGFADEVARIASRKYGSKRSSGARIRATLLPDPLR